jgi:hypothetical protein
VAGREGTRAGLTLAACLLLAAGGGGGDRRTGACEPAPVRETGPPAFAEIPGVPQGLPHAVSAHGDVVAFFFVHPLRARRLDLRCGARRTTLDVRVVAAASS